MTQRRLRILQAGPLPPPLSGIGVSLQQLLGSRALRAHDTFALDTSARHLPGDPGRAKRPTPRRLTRHIRLAIETGQLVRRRHIDVLHLHGSSHDLSLFGNALSVMSAHAAGARTIWHLHEDLGVVAFPGRRRLTQTLFSRIVTVSDALAVLSERDRVVANHYMDPRRVTVLPPTCSSEFTDVPLVRPTRGRSVEVLFVGWLTAAKGIYDLLQVAELLRESGPPVTFKVVGSGMTDDETANVQSSIDGRGLGSIVELCGVLSGEPKLRRFAQADILLHPTHWDAFPVVVLEAMAAGLPIVSTRVGGVPTLVEHASGGLLAEVSDVAHLAEHIATLASSPADRVRMGRFNRQKFETSLHPEVVARTAVDLYCKVVGQAPVRA